MPFNFDIEHFFSFLKTPFFQNLIPILKIVSIAFCSLMLGFIIWASLKTDYFRRRYFWDWKEFATFHPYTAKKLYGKWQKIRGRLNSGLETEYKLAVIEADSLMDEIIKGMGFTGETFPIRLKNLTTATLPNINDVLIAHDVRNNIVHDPDFRLSLAEAKKAFEIYETALTDLQAL
jgi:hypothetical protein